jgi:hypothetical protein
LHFRTKEFLLAVKFSWKWKTHKFSLRKLDKRPLKTEWAFSACPKSNFSYPTAFKCPS